MQATCMYMISTQEVPHLNYQCMRSTYGHNCHKGSISYLRACLSISLMRSPWACLRENPMFPVSRWGAASLTLSMGSVTRSFTACSHNSVVVVGGMFFNGGGSEMMSGRIPRRWMASASRRETMDSSRLLRFTFTGTSHNTIIVCHQWNNELMWTTKITCNS